MCSCVNEDAYICWAERYNLSESISAFQFMAYIITDGGPCQCWCHDEDEWSDEEDGGDD